MSKLNLLAIDIGHNINYDTGAADIRNEDELNRLVGQALINKCTNVGIQAINCTPSTASSLSDSLKKRCNTANNNNADFFLSIHHNAGGGHGAEALVYKEGLGSQVGNSILNNLSDLGLTNRGVKIRRNLAVLRNTNMPALLMECAFIDSSRDMSNYDVNAVAECIFKGICLVFHIASISDSEYYTVAKGDTLCSISRRYGVSVNDLVRINGITNPNLIVIGQKILIR